MFTLELQARNIHLNRLSNHVTIVPLPLFERVEVNTLNTLNTSSTQWGGALSTFSATHGFDSDALRKVFEFRTFGLSMDDCLRKVGLLQPEYLKMDVDGIERRILRAGQRMLAGLRGVSVEITDALTEQADEWRRALEGAGMRFVSKARSAIIDTNPAFNRTFNQVWTR